MVSYQTPLQGCTRATRKISFAQVGGGATRGLVYYTLDDLAIVPPPPPPRSWPYFKVLYTLVDNLLVCGRRLKSFQGVYSSSEMTGCDCQTDALGLLGLKCRWIGLPDPLLASKWIHSVDSHQSLLFKWNMPPLHFTKEWIKPKCFNKKEKLFEAFESTSSKKIGLVAKSNQFSQKG